MVKKILLVVILLLLSTQLSFATDSFQEGFDAYKNQDYQVVLNTLLPLGVNGHPYAQLILSFMYFDGNGVPRDCDKGQKFMRKAVTTERELAKKYNIDTFYSNCRDKEMAEAWKMGTEDTIKTLEKIKRYQNNINSDRQQPH